MRHDFFLQRNDHDLSKKRNKWAIKTTNESITNKVILYRQDVQMNAYSVKTILLLLR